jgi:large subunit ribosomal protein L7/L12
MVDGLKVHSDVEKHVNEIYDQVSALPVAGVVKLVKKFQEEWGISLAVPQSGQPAASAGASGGAAAGVAEESKTNFTVVLKSCDAAGKLKVIQALRKIQADMSVPQAKTMVESVIGGTEAVLKESVSKEEAEDIKAKLGAEGAIVELR